MEKKIIIECSCGCGNLKFTSDVFDGHEEIFIEHYLSSFYSHQKPGWTAFKNRMKMIWCALTGKDYQLYDIILAGKDVGDFKKKMKEFVE